MELELQEGRMRQLRRFIINKKEKPCKGDWCEMIEKDFNFIGEEIDEDFIKQTPKYIYSNYIKQKVQQAAFNSYIEIKEKSKTKMKNIKVCNAGVSRK